MMMVRAIFLNPPTICTSVNLVEHSCGPAVHLKSCCRNDVVPDEFSKQNVAFCGLTGRVCRPGASGLPPRPRERRNKHRGERLERVPPVRMISYIFRHQG